MMTAGMVSSRRNTGAMLFNMEVAGAATPFTRLRAPAGTTPLASARGPPVKLPTFVRGAARETAAAAKVAKKENECIMMAREKRLW